jgi:hypothetical protein
LIISAIKGFHGQIDLKKSYWPALDDKRQAVCSLPHPRNERQHSVIDFYFCIMDNHWAALQHYAIIGVLAVFIGPMASNDIATTS